MHSVCYCYREICREICLSDVHHPLSLIITLRLLNNRVIHHSSKPDVTEGESPQKQSKISPKSEVVYLFSSYVNNIPLWCSWYHTIHQVMRDLDPSGPPCCYIAFSDTTFLCYSRFGVALPTADNLLKCWKYHSG